MIKTRFMGYFPFTSSSTSFAITLLTRGFQLIAGAAVFRPWTFTRLASRDASLIYRPPYGTAKHAKGQAYMSRATFGSAATAIQNCSMVSTMFAKPSFSPGFVINPLAWSPYAEWISCLNRIP